MTKASKIRLDMVLVSRGLFPSREAARRAIMAGLVSLGNEIIDKPGTFVPEHAPLEVKLPEHQFVSRGGLKLERALQVFPVSLANRVVIDVGASTGGFTDCALQHGASRVYAVDVGYGQLAWKLRTDNRVVVYERMNFRHADAQQFLPRPDIGVMDVSFISIRHLLPKLCEVLPETGQIISLIKPQFEVGRDRVGKGGIVRDPKAHLELLHDMREAFQNLGLYFSGLDYSPISGGDGNIEYLAWLTRQPLQDTSPVDNVKIHRSVEEAWLTLKGEDVSGQIS